MEARKAIKQERDYDLVLLDLRLPDTQGVRGLLSLKAHFPQLRVLVVSAYAHQDTIQNCFLLGPNGFLSKSLRLKVLEATIDKVMAGKKVVPSERDVAGGVVPPRGSFNPLKRLAFQQARVLHYVCPGLLNNQFAVEMGVGETTVRAHMREIFRKLGAASRTQALVRIMRLEPGQDGADHAIEQAT